MTRIKIFALAMVVAVASLMACTPEAPPNSNGADPEHRDPWANIYVPAEAELLTSGEQQVPPNINLWARFYELPTDQRFYVEITVVEHTDGIDQVQFDEVIDDISRTDELQGVRCTTQGKIRAIETGTELHSIKVGMCVLGRLPAKSWDFDEDLVQQILDSYELQ